MGRKDGGASERWLTLTEASRTLGITPNTLRRWADRGEIPSFITPGGHRRFPLTAIMSLVPSHRAKRPALAAMGASSDQMAKAYRRARPTARSRQPIGWLSNLSESERIHFRRRGTALVGKLLAYLDADRERGAPLLAAAQRQASEYGAGAARAGASMSDAVEGFLRFRRPFVDQLALLARRRHLDTREATELLADAEDALDRLLVALMLGHRAGSGER